MNAFFYKDIAYPDGVIGGKDYYNPVIYSTTERVIGVWIDNKPLYQKTISFPAFNGQAYSLSLGIANVDKIFFIPSGSYNNNGVMPLPYVIGRDNSNNIGGYFSIGESDTTFDFRVGSGSAGYIQGGYITVAYTKTTDTAGSAPYNNNGVPTVRYSTDEQIIGLWADGKPLYRKTWTGLSSPTNGNEWATLQGVDASLWDEIIKMQLYTYVNNKLTNIALSEYRAFNGVAQISIVSSVFDRTVNVATIEYTKTTD